jgi:large subunit ribosomal protein L29
MKAADIHEFTEDELNKSKGDSQRELFNLKIQHALGQLEDTSQIRSIRRDIARLRTEENQRVSAN